MVKLRRLSACFHNISQTRMVGQNVSVSMFCGALLNN